MKAVILETKNGKAAVLAKGGEMRYIDDKGYESGQIIELPEMNLQTVSSPSRFKGSRKAIAAAVSLAVLLSAGGVTAYAAPVSTVSLGTSPAIEYKVNVFDRVVGFSADNETEEETVKASYVDVEKKVRGKKIDDAIDITFNELGENISSPSVSEDQTVTVNSILPGHDERIRSLVQVRMDEHMRNEALPSGPIPENEDTILPENNGTEAPAPEINTDEAHTPDIQEPAGIPDALPQDNMESLPENAPGNVPGNVPGNIPENAPAAGITEEAPGSMENIPSPWENTPAPQAPQAPQVPQAPQAPQDNPNGQLPPSQ
ncbi:MAG: hypothetical protein K6A69_08625 [Lachnospiraceae bacterium]|nr:hypothetical protein [Lachnospiraceae bacterium]